MDKNLSFEIAHPFEPRTASLEVSEYAVNRTVWLRDTYVLFFVARGSLTIQTTKIHVDVGAGQTYLLNKNPADRIKLSVGSDTEHYLLGFRLSSSNTSISGEAQPLEVPAFAVLLRPERLTYLMRRYLAQQERGDSSRTILGNLLVLVLHEIALSGSAVRSDADDLCASEIIAWRVDAYIAAHYREHIGTPDIAVELRYNPDYLERAYRLQRDLSIRDAIHLRRVREAAAQLLIHRERSVSDIAGMCGFQDANYFRRVFKRAMNMTPNRYRYLNATKKGARVSV